MKFVIQRVNEASVEVNNGIVGKINKGFLVLVGITHNDNIEIADRLVKKLINLRVFEDKNEKMNLALKDVKGELLLISQFTLYANCKDGNRPAFIDAAKPDFANELYEYVIEQCKKENINVQTGIFGADMKVSLINDGPVTIILDSDQLFKRKGDKNE
ncbi:MAG: D-tyrosyl-tRNA(Tyr) deacylase [Clostridia bacterium]|nr:D-tyrosyl-tRNA(Tyr) deacylase [Clostridia bacterium]